MKAEKEFIKFLKSFYKENKRASLPWRKNKNPYHILLSEIMLQQTQVSRVLIKYKEFLKKFPTVQSLASAPLRDVLTLWQGLGYNRRAKFLHQASQIIAKANKKDFMSYEFWNSLPGVGQSTTGAVLVFTQDKPIVFIETNIRAVLLHHFFKDKKKVDDKQIREVLEKLLSLLPADFGPRDFYYAMYDYGTHLKTTLGKFKKDLHKKSKHYNKQSKFVGSRRQLRAFILKTFLDMKGKLKSSILEQKVLKTRPASLADFEPKDVKTLISQLKNEGFF